MHQEHIQRLTPHDTAVLRASHEFPTFTDAFARVAQVGLPTLEAETQEIPLFDNDEDASHDVAVSLCLSALAWDITRTRVLAVTDRVRQRIELAMRSDGEPSGTPASTENINHTTLQIGALELFSRLAAISTDVSVSVSLVLEENTAAVRDVSHTGELTNGREAAAGRRNGVAAHSSSQPSLLVRTLVPETRWHCGQPTHLTEKIARRHGSAHHSPSCPGGGDNESSSHGHLLGIRGHPRKRGSFLRLITVCRVRGLFYNLPVRQTPFVALVGRCSFDVLTTTKKGGAGSACKPACVCDGEELLRRRTLWARKSASAMRARREEQHRLMAVVFQTAVCTLLAPLYLADASLDASRERDTPLAWYSVPVHRASVFSAQLMTECDLSENMSVTQCAPAEARLLRPLSLSKAPRCSSAPCTGHGGNGMHADPMTTVGLRVDRYGLYKGTLWARQATSREAHAGKRPGPRPTPGEETACRLCRAFGIFPPNPSSAPPLSPTRAELRVGQSCPLPATSTSCPGTACSSEGATEDGVLTEVVVRHGLFSVLFATPPPLGITALHTSQDPPTVDSLPAVPFLGLQRTLSMIVVRESQVHTPEDDAHRGHRHPPSSALRLAYCRVLETTHWAYDIIAANTHRRRRDAHAISTGSISPAAATAVPIFVFVDSAYVPSRISEARRADSPLETFVQLYDEALQRLTRSLRGCEIGPTPLGDVKHLQYSINPPHATMPNHKQQSSLATHHALLKQENAEVELRMRYLCQRVLEAAAVPGTPLCMPPLPSTENSAATSPSASVAARTAALHHVRIHSDSLLCLGASGHTLNSSTPVPRRTPVTLDPNLDRIAKEEEKVQAALRTHATIKTASTCMKSLGAAHPSPLDRSPNTVERLTRIRHLLDTGRGNALRRLPRAFALPCPWMPMREVNKSVESEAGLLEGTNAAAASANGMPPITTVFSADVSVLQWARKFLIVASTTTSMQHAPEPPGGSAVAIPQHPAHRPHPHALQWWIADQHAVHERVRLEFFLCFADTYVCHPELQHVMNHTKTECVLPESFAGSECAAGTWLPLSPQAQQSLEHRHRIAQLLWSLTATDSACPQKKSSVASSFPVTLPDEWRLRVTAVEAHLRQWGWRFYHENPVDVHRGEVQCRKTATLAKSGHLRQATAVLAWPCLSVEGVVHHFTSMQALQHTVEELEAVGAASNVELDSTLMPPPMSLTEPVFDRRCPVSPRVPRPSSPTPLLIPSIFLDFFVSRSCRGAIMFGDVLRPTAARSIVAALDCVEQFYVCSHGRPSFTHLTPT